MSSQQSNEGEIRKNLLEADLVDCMVALPGQLFYSTQIPACLWFLSRSRGNGPFRDRRGEVLFIDAHRMGIMRDRKHRELTANEITRITTTYHAWRGETDAGEYTDVLGFCHSSSLQEIRKHDYVITPSRYVGTEPSKEDTEPFEAKMTRLVNRWLHLQIKSQELNENITNNLKDINFKVGPKP